METKQRTYENRTQPRLVQVTKTDVRSEKQNLPLKKFRIGSISATIWENHTKNQEGQLVSYKSVSFERGYKDANGEWQSTNALRANDLPKAILVLNKAYEYLAFNNAETEE